VKTADGMENRNQGATLALWVLLLWGGWVLRLHRLGEDSLWFDEVFTWRYASPALLEIPRLLHRQAQPFLAMIPFHFALRVGEGEFLLRFPAACSGLLVVPVVYTLVRRLWGRPEGWLAAGMAVVSPFLVRYSQEARAYTLLLVLSTLSAAYLWQALRTNERWQWAGFCCSLALALYTHYFALFVLAVEGLFGALVLGRAWLLQWRTGGKWPPPARVRAFALSILAFVLAYLPWVPVMRVNFFERQLGKEAATQVSRWITPAVMGDMLAGMGTGPGWASWAVLGLAIAGLGTLMWQRRWRVLLLVGLCFAVPWGTLGLITPRKLLPRYLIFLVPFYYGLAAAGAVGLARAIPRSWAGRPKWAGRVTAALLIALVFVVPGGSSVGDYYDEQKMDLRGVAWFLAHNVRPGQAISAPSYDRFMDPYQPSLQEQFLPSLSLEMVQEIYRTWPRVWFVQGWGQRVNIDRDGSMTAWMDSLPAVVVEFYDVRVLYVGEGVPLEVLLAESRGFVLPEGAVLARRE
jgi:mannosyltransferase